MLRKLLISLMTIGLLAGCMQDKNEPQQDEKPVDEKIQDDIDNIEKETDAPEESKGDNNTEDQGKPEDEEE